MKPAPSGMVSCVAVLWEEIRNCLRVANRSFWGSGRPRVPWWPFRWAGVPRPHYFEKLSGPPGPADPRNNQFPTLKKLRDFL